MEQLELRHQITSRSSSFLCIFAVESLLHFYAKYPFIMICSYPFLLVE